MEKKTKENSKNQKKNETNTDLVDVNKRKNRFDSKCGFLQFLLQPYRATTQNHCFSL